MCSKFLVIVNIVRVMIKIKLYKIDTYASTQMVFLIQIWLLNKCNNAATCNRALEEQAVLWKKVWFVWSEYTFTEEIL
jgi:hypothetical protein